MNDNMRLISDTVIIYMTVTLNVTVRSQENQSKNRGKLPALALV